MNTILIQIMASSLREQIQDRQTVVSVISYDFWQIWEFGQIWEWAILGHLNIHYLHT